jgi:hypothetical protein
LARITLRRKPHILRAPEPPFGADQLFALRSSARTQIGTLWALRDRGRPRRRVLAIPRARKQARPNVATPAARAAGIEPLAIIVDTREQYAYRFSTQQVVLQRRALPCGDHGVTVSERLVAVVER